MAKSSKEACEESVCTTQLPADDDTMKSDSSAGSMITGSTSKKNRSRPDRQKGPKRKARNIRRAQEHYASQGKEWKYQSKVHQESCEVATGLKGSDAESMHAQIMEQKKMNQCQKEMRNRRPLKTPL